ncbi:DNA polymerase III subunit gamma and tau [Zhihengliuella sp.]|uniref:DNA polymerase III subunit gamma and tau n=1 Tax=Zhihengliuella sp. TaxID=1954483 RepID=UPI0028127637|nr:DNA polymerase III subunit gamma and tau [Zhihengliuella sp.]
MSTALYRRYRPDTFAEVIGQEHVTTPLMTALEKDRVNHAYLFSGPRGCGKTTSARILARCLNCEQGPTPNPCGQCPSCIDLATGGAGSLDVIEIDAASHGGVDDARDLRERATFAPTRDRFKIFIIDEAHMVTSAGFNALLKIVEEPPPHIKFIFATTEPDKVIGTIRSRTHHYPFRLVPPETLMEYLERLCAQEGVPVAPGVLSLVLRAGGGSVRDTLSVLDQLIAGAGPDGLDYELAVSLLGYTHAALLDDVVDALAANDAATVFGVVDRVVQTGHDPRRFVDDLLERFRDLIIVKAMPDSAAQIIRGVPEDQLDRMRQQAATLGQGELSRSADVTNQALTEMSGATSPRLHLELLCARLLLPASDTGENGVVARVDRIERHLTQGGAAPLASGPAQYDAGSPAGALADSGAGIDGNGGAAAVREALRAAKARQDQDGPAAAPPAVPAEAPAAETPPVGTPSAEAPSAGEPAAAAPAAGTSAAAVPAPAAPAEGSPAVGGLSGPPASPETAAQVNASGAPQASPSSVPAPQESSASGGVPRPAAPAEHPADARTDHATAHQPSPQSSAEPAQQPAPPAPAPSPAQGSAADWGGTWAAVPEPPRQTPAPAASAGQSAPAPTPTPTPTPTPEPSAPTSDPTSGRTPAPTSAPTESRSAPGYPAQQPSSSQQDAGEQPTAESAPSQPGGTGSVEMFRRAWPEVLKVVAGERRAVQMNLQQNAAVSGFDGRMLTVSFANPGALAHFTSRPDNGALLQWAINQVLGVQVEIDVAAGGSVPTGGSGPKADRRPEPASAGNPTGNASTRAAAPTPRPQSSPPRDIPPFRPEPQLQEHYERPAAPEWTEFPPADATQPAETGESRPVAGTATPSEPQASTEVPANTARPTTSAASAASAASAPSVDSAAPALSADATPSAPSADATASAPSEPSSGSAASAPSAGSAAEAEPVGPAPSASSAASAPSAPSPASAAPQHPDSRPHAGSAPVPPESNDTAPATGGWDPADGWVPPDEPPAEDEPPYPYDDGGWADAPDTANAPGPSTTTDAAGRSAQRAQPGEPQGQTPASGLGPPPVIPPAPKGPTPPPPSWAGSALPPTMRPEASEKPVAPEPDQQRAQKVSRYQRLLAQAQGDGGSPIPGGVSRGSGLDGTPGTGGAPFGGSGEGGTPAGSTPSYSGSSNPGMSGPGASSTGAPSPGTPGGFRGAGPASGAQVVDSSYAGSPANGTEYFEPSDDDIAIEDSTLIGRAAIERILNGRLIEERGLDGTPVN